MSPVFAAAFLWLVFAVLWWSGWRDETAGGISRVYVASFLIGWPIFFLLHFEIKLGITVNGALLWTVLAAALLAIAAEPSRRWVSLSAGMLFGAMELLLLRAAAFPAGLFSVAMSWGSAVLVGVMSALLLRTASEQIIAVSVAVFLTHGLLAAAYPDVAALNVPIETLENWWFSIAIARLVAFVAFGLAELADRWSQRSGWRRG